MVYFTAKANGATGGVDVYAMVPYAAPKPTSALVAIAKGDRPTGRRASELAARGSAAPEAELQQQPAHAAATGLVSGGLTLDTFRPALMSPGLQLVKAQLLGVAGEVKVTQHATGLQLEAAGIIPSPPPAHLADGVVFKLSFEAKSAEL